MEKPRIGAVITEDGNDFTVIACSETKRPNEWVALTFSPDAETPYMIMGYLSGYHWQLANVRSPYPEFDAAHTEYCRIRYE